MSLRTIKAEARERLHRVFEVEARCFRAGDPSHSESVTLRVHSAVVDTGDLPSSGLSFSERVDVSPTLVFLIGEHRPIKANVYSVSETEAYRVDHVEPVDGITVSVVCDRLSELDAASWYSA